MYLLVNASAVKEFVVRALTFPLNRLDTCIYVFAGINLDIARAHDNPRYACRHPPTIGTYVPR